jgi:hypothetical protein
MKSSSVRAHARSVIDFKEESEIFSWINKLIKINMNKYFDNFKMDFLAIRDTFETLSRTFLKIYSNSTS